MLFLASRRASSHIMDPSQPHLGFKMIPGLWTTLALFFLRGSLGFQGLAMEERLMKPELSFAREHIIVHAGEPFTITCRGLPGLMWLRENDPSEDDGRWHVYEQKCSDRPWLTCSTLTTDRASAGDTGYVTCLYRQFRSNEELKAKIYVFFKDNKKPFVDPYTEHPKVIYIHNATEVIVVPCRVTSPDIIPDLQLHAPATVFSQKRKDWDPKRGFLVTSPSFEFFSGILKCVTNVDGVTFMSLYLPQKVEYRIQNLVLKGAPQKLLVGETLHLMCTAETFFNGRIEFDWKFPRGKVHKPTNTLDQSEAVYKATSNVTIQHVLMEDRGLYVCKGQIANNTRKELETNITVTVYREPFLKLFYKKEQNYEAKVGQKMLRLAWKVDAFPRPNVTWYKNSNQIAENNSYYELDPLKYRLVIRDLRAKHAGNYTISLSNTKHGLYENLTSRLVVLVKPCLEND